MHKVVFYGTLLSNAKYQLKNLEHLLIRAEHGFLAERSIDQAIDHLMKTHEQLTQAKLSYITHHQAHPVQSHPLHLPQSLSHPHTSSHLS